MEDKETFSGTRNMADNLISAFRREDIKCFVSESWSICWPMTLIMFFDFLIGLADVYMAGRLGKEIQAAYGFAIQIYFVFIIVGNALTVGAVSVVSRIFTTGNKEELADAVYTSLLTAAVAGLVFGTAGILLTPQIVHLANIPDQLKPLCIPLGRIYATGFVFQTFLINSNGILRACNSVKASLKTMTVVCLANIVFLFLFVFHTPLGFKGIALAAASGGCIGALLNFWHLRRLINPTKRFSSQIMKRIVSVGWPSGILQALWQLSSMAIYLIISIVPVHRIEILAALTTGLRIESAIYLPAFAFNMANAVIVGNLLGARKEDDAFRGGVITALMGVVVVTILTAAVVTNIRWIVPLLSDNHVVIAESMKYLYINMLSEPFMAWWVILAGGLNGAGDTKGVMVRVVLVIWVVRVPLCYVFAGLAGLGVVTVWWTMVFSQWMLAAVITKRYLAKKWLEQNS